RMQQDKVFRRDPHNLYHRIDRKGLEKVAPSFPWGDFLARLGIGGVTAVTVNDPKFYGQLARMLGTERPAALRNYMTWTLVRTYAPFLGKAFVAESFALDQVLAGTKEDMPRWRRCERQVDADLGELLGQAYVAMRFTGESKPRATELTRAVLD